MEDYYQRINYEFLGAIKRKAINKYALISDNFWMIPVRFTTVIEPQKPQKLSGRQFTPNIHVKSYV